MAMQRPDATDAEKEHNLIKILERDLERSVKEVIERNILTQQMEEFAAKIRPIIKEQVEKISFSGIKNMRDLLNMRDELILHIQWSDEEERKKMYKVENTVVTEVLDK
jgi:hypothetical protein